MMGLRVRRAPRNIAALAALQALLLTGAAHAADGPFGGFAGSWSGTGTVSVSNGSKERIRCRATYSVTPSGEQLHQALRCASDSYKFDVDSNVLADEGGNLSGTWTETTRQVTGAVSGRVTPGAISTSVKGPAFSATLTAQNKGNSQTVSIRPEGTEITGIMIEMKRG